MLIIEWTIENQNNTDQLQKQILSIEQELHYLVKLKHTNLVQYLNIKHEYNEIEEKFIIHILQEFVYGIFTY